MNSARASRGILTGTPVGLADSVHDGEQLRVQRGRAPSSTHLRRSEDTCTGTKLPWADVSRRRDAKIRVEIEREITSPRYLGSPETLAASGNPDQSEMRSQ